MRHQHYRKFVGGSLPHNVSGKRAKIWGHPLKTSFAPGPSPRFCSRRAKNHKGGTFFKYNIGSMQQPRGKIWNGGHRFQITAIQYLYLWYFM